MNGVNLKNNETIEHALRRFKKLYDNSGLLADFKQRQHFVKPSTIKRERLKSAIRKAKKEKILEEKKHAF